MSHGMLIMRVHSGCCPASRRRWRGTGKVQYVGCTRDKRAREGRHSMTTAATAVAPAGVGPQIGISKTLRVAVVGDVHGQWNDSDVHALKMLNPDITLFVGDFGDEDLELVKKIAALPIAKAVILGNHDAWYTMTDLGLRRRRRFVKETKTNKLHGWNKVRAQLSELGDCHVGYSALAVPGKDVSIVGARPFSKGGSSFDQVRPFCREYFQVDTPEASARRIVAAAQGQPAQHSMIVMGHNGPFGLGAERFDICGLDFLKRGGDFGDPDLQSALDQMQHLTMHVPLVVFGHMHERLKSFAVKQPGISGGGTRRRVYVHPYTGTVMVNAAVVPRTKDSSKLSNGDHVQQHHFVVVEMVDGEVMEVKDVWVEVDPSGAQEGFVEGEGLVERHEQPGDGNLDGTFAFKAPSTSPRTLSLLSPALAPAPPLSPPAAASSHTTLPALAGSTVAASTNTNTSAPTYSTSNLTLAPSTSDLPPAFITSDSLPNESAMSSPSNSSLSLTLTPAYVPITGCRLVSEHVFLQTIQGPNGGVVKMAWDGYRKSWKAVLPRPRAEVVTAQYTAQQEAEPAAVQQEAQRAAAQHAATISSIQQPDHSAEHSNGHTAGSADSSGPTEVLLHRPVTRSHSEEQDETSSNAADFHGLSTHSISRDGVDSCNSRNIAANGVWLNGAGLQTGRGGAQGHRKQASHNATAATEGMSPSKPKGFKEVSTASGPETQRSAKLVARRRAGKASVLRSVKIVK